MTAIAMGSGLTLEAIARDDDPRVIVPSPSLSLSGHRFEERFIPTPEGATASPQSRQAFTREELSLRPIVARWLDDEAVEFPAAIRSPDGLTARDLRRRVFLESEWASSLLASSAP